MGKSLKASSPATRRPQVLNISRCMPGWPLAVLGYFYAAAAVAALAAAALADAWQRRERRATYELAPRGDDWPLPEA